MDKRLDEKVAGETQVQTRADVSREMQQRIETAPGLTQDQRSKLCVDQFGGLLVREDPARYRGRCPRRR